MKETVITEELWTRFLDGKTNEEETELVTQLMAEDNELLVEYLSVLEASKRVDECPCRRPDFELAQKQIHETLCANASEKEKLVMLPRRSNIRKYFAVAAVAVLLIGVALFLLFRPDHSDNNFAQQEEKHIESVAKEPNKKQEVTDETKPIESIRSKGQPSRDDTEDVQPTSSETSSEYYTTQKLEKKYATTQEVNSLTVAKPSKESYRVLCKNLDKSFSFEWSATNVKTLHFEVKDSKGKSVAETKDVSANYYSLKYSDLYPEQKLTWSLIVVFKDGSQDMRKGQIQIDYNH